MSVVAWPLRELLDEDANAQALPGMQASAPPQLPPLSELRSITDVQAAIGGPSDSFTRVLIRKRDRDANAGALTSTLLSSTTRGEQLLWSSICLYRLYLAPGTPMQWPYLSDTCTAGTSSESNRQAGPRAHRG